MKIEAAIFDLDGVIVNTAKMHYIAWKKLADSLGIDFSEKDNQKLKGVSRMRSLEILLELGGLKVTKEKMLEYAKRKNNQYRQLISTLTPNDILPGVYNFMNNLRFKGLKIVLGSSSKNAKTILKYIGLKDFFDAVIDGTKVTKAKPDPDIFLLGATEVGVSPKKCIVFEDATAGVEAAKNANMFAVGVGEENKFKNADFVLSCFENVDFKLIQEKLDI